MRHTLIVYFYNKAPNITDHQNFAEARSAFRATPATESAVIVDLAGTTMARWTKPAGWVLTSIDDLDA